MSQSDFVSRGQALVAAGQFQEAVKVCRLGLLGRPTTVEGRVVLGQALLALKRYDEVLAEMRVALELDHTSIPAQILKAEALLRKGDVAPAIEALHKARQAAPGDQRILQLLGEAEHGSSHRPSVSHPAVGFVAQGDTKHYPGHPAGSEPFHSESFTKPTSLSSPGGERRSSQRRAAVAPAPTPPPNAFAGDRTGTVEVDPELEGVELEGELDFDDLAAPPRGAPNKIGGPRGAVVSSRGGGGGEQGTVMGKKSAGKEARPVLLDLEEDDDVEELGETLPPGARRNSRPSEVRSAVGLPSSVIGEAGESMRMKAQRSVPPPRSNPASVPPPRSNPASVPPPSRPNPASVPPPTGGLSRTYQAASAPPPGRAMPLGMPGPPAAPLPPAPIAAALPTVAAAPSPFAPPANIAANRPTLAGALPPPISPDRFFGAEEAAQQWVAPHIDPHSMAAANEPTARPSELDPQILALMSGQPEPNPAMALDQSSVAPAGPMKTGMRRRSKLQVAMWILIGAAVIGGGVFAGFQIRAMRLDKQIVAARKRATDLAKADGWKGWRDARDSLAGIVEASSTTGNRAALARVRALIAYELGDGILDAKRDVDALAGQGGLDGHLAAAYLALAQSDAKGAKLAAAAALDAAKDDAAAHYVAGQAALLSGDAKDAITHLKTANEKESRPLYGVGLARAYAAAYNWEEAIAAIDRVLAGNADHPAASILRAQVLTAAGRIFPGSALANEVRQQLERVVAQGKRAVAEQKDGVSPAQVAFGHLALAHVNFMRNDVKVARNDVKLALAVNLDDQRFAEEAIDTLYLIGDLPLARSAADKALVDYPTSRRARIGLARVLTAQGKPNDAIDMLSKQADMMATPDALAARGHAHLAAGDPTSAAVDFDNALKKLPAHEPSIIGRAWLELAAGDVDAATKRTGERFNAKGTSIALTTAYAAALRRSPDQAQRDKAKELLEKVVQGPNGPDGARAQLELARIYRDAGLYRDARTAFQAAITGGSAEARLDYGLLLFDDRDPRGGRDVLDKLLEEAGERPSPVLVIEGARARMLAGDHAGATKLLAIADKVSAIERWKLDRERGRLAMRKSDFPAAGTALARALDTCGNDSETFLLAAELAGADKTIADKVKKLAGERLKGRPEAKIVEGKLLILGEKYADAETSYRQAKEALKNEKASPRRLAQADFGLGVVAYAGENAPEALRTFELVLDQDPSLVDAYTFAAELTKDPKKAFGYAQKAAQFNPDYAYAWLLVGRGAHRVGDKKTLADAISRLTAIAPQGDELKELKSLRR